ncbi:MAG: sigma-70 family RNA polymerase sigma factor [Gammaproteobacteria bacterium]|nr:sigma-70 family RNA polymerase sigma factor [Gammaproteobacteria bacterium]
MIAVPLTCHIQSVTKTPIDEELCLIRAVAASDRIAFEKLFRRFHPRIYKFAHRMVQDHQLAEEVTGDTLYAVWTGAKNFKEQSKASTWILGIAYKRALKCLQKNQRHVAKRESDVELDTLTSESPEGNPETFANTALENQRLLLALSTLSTDHRAVLELIALGHSCSEIAGIVDCPENTVKTRTFHARRHLRKALQE